MEGENYIVPSQVLYFPIPLFIHRIIKFVIPNGMGLEGQDNHICNVPLSLPHSAANLDVICEDGSIT